MAIADKLTKLATDITNAYEAIDDKGGTIPANKNTDNLENAIKSIETGITPTGTKQISITQNGTTTEDVTNFANAQIVTNVVNQDYEDALVAFGVTEDLADSIEALTTYSNELTGEGDTTLSDAVRTLADGYDGGSSPVYEATSTTGVFFTDMAAPLKKLLVSLEPTQSGSGTPSPTNIRPISGRNSVKVTVSSTELATDGTTYTTALGRTVYGGILDVVSGLLTVYRRYLTVSDFSLWGGDSVSAGGLHWVNVPKSYPTALAGNGNICSHAEYFDGGNGWLSTIPAYSTAGSFPARIYVQSNSMANFQAEYANLQAVYMLAEPQTYQLTPQQINTFKGNNTVTTEGADVIDIVYSTHVLPTEYQAVSYIENKGSSYIDTGYSMTSDVTEQSIQFFSRPSGDSSIFGAERSGAYTGVLWTATGSVSSALFIGGTNNAITEALQLGIWHTVTIKTTSETSGTLTVDGYERSFTYSGGILKGYPIWLFNNNNASTAQYAKNRIARFHIIDDGVKVRDLVACYRKSDNKPGMYDLANNVFYTNAGTGEFTIGEDI